MALLKNKWIWGSLMVVPVWIAYSWLSGTSGLINQFSLYRQNENLQHQIDSLTLLKTELDEERARLRSDTLYLEKIIRKELGMARKGEQVYMLYSEK